MRKHLKSIAAAIMAVVMLMSISMSAMAAEQVTAVGETAAVEETATSLPIADGVLENKPNYFKTTNTFTDSPNMLIGGINITGQKNTIRHKLTGNLLSGTIGKAVIFRLRNGITGETRSFTAGADGAWFTTSYYSDLAPGNYEIWVIFTEKVGKYTIEMEATYTNLS